MDKKLALVLIVLFGIFACGCTSQTQPGQTNQTVTSTPVPQGVTSGAQTPASTTDTGTVTTTPVPGTPAVSPSGKSQYLAEVNGYLENISVTINSIKIAKSSLDYPTLKASGDQLDLNVVLGNRFSYKGDDPSLIKIDAMFPLYRDNLKAASIHYYEAGSKGLINDTVTAFHEIEAGDAYYYKAMEPGRKIIEELKKQNVSISKNIQDAHGIWFVEGSKVYS